MWHIICESVIFQITEQACSETLPTDQLVPALGSHVGRREKVQGLRAQPCGSVLLEAVSILIQNA